MIGWFIGGAVDFTWTIEYAVQTGQARIVSIKWPFPLPGLGATESSIVSCVLRVIDIISTFVFTASGLAIAISGF